jgi:hypothetical protein
MSDLNQQQSAWMDIQIVEKTIEPDVKISPDQANRNMQLGNIAAPEFTFLAHRHERGMDLLNYPHERNGWMYKKYGLALLRKNDANLLLSGSKDGFVRQLLRTSTQVQRMKDETDRGLFKSTLGRKE